MKNNQPLSLYFHIPFCKKKCDYCDFTSYAGKDHLIPVYVDSLIKEMEFIGLQFEDKLEIQSIYFGGGTPSLVPVDQFEKLFKSFNVLFNILPAAEISLEVNPGTINEEYLHGLQNLGFNRISIGVQSTNDKELLLLGRIHDRNDELKSVAAARNAQFTNLNLDLIYGLPGQRLMEWKANLTEAINFDPEHISLYALTIEEGTPFGDKAKNRQLEIPDPDLAADMYEWSGDLLENSGYKQYEISNWAKNGFECLQNLATWRNKEYLGFGAGAHSFYGDVRFSNTIVIRDYINKITNNPFIKDNHKSAKFLFSPAMVTQQPISKFTSMQETLMLGLRLTSEGVHDQEFFKKFGNSIREVFGEELGELTRSGLVEWNGEILKLSKKGRLLGNQVFIRFVS